MRGPIGYPEHFTQEDENKACLFCNGFKVFLGANCILYRCYCVKDHELNNK